MDSDCKSKKSCKLRTCPGQRLSRVAPFFRHYKALVSDCTDRGVISSHDDLIRVFKGVTSHSEESRSEIRQQLVDTWPSDQRPRPDDVDCAINLAVRAVFMINCSAEAVAPGLLEQGDGQICWRDNVSFSDFIDEAFPATDDPLFGKELVLSDIRCELTVRRLKKRLGVSFRPTSDIRSHLRYDRKTNTLEIFHHTTLLKEHLRLTKDRQDDVSTAGAVQAGTLPRQIALEVIDSIQQLLFPLTDAKSSSILRSMVSKYSMDPDCLRFESVAVRNDDENDVPYLYFGSRLADLYDELQNPQPRGQFAKWLERRSEKRHVMLATWCGVMAAILFGLVSLIAAVIQAYVGYMAWKHPISSS